jgi:signal transduction histidine kinase
MRWQQFKQPWQLLLWLLMVVFSMILAYRSQRQLRERKEMLRIRDNSVELEMSMKSKNQALMEKQDYEVHVATLQERNRIAREIHDNVGHMLSRSILQMGALMTIHKEEPLHSQLSSVSDSLNEAMNNIRESVHDLHDESIDLRQAVVDATSEMRKKYTVNLEYDMTAGVPCNVKYCMISIVKEAMSNVVKHSNGNKVTIILREHPAFFQLFIGDNGTDIDFSNPGIGLTNMRDRVETLGGTINFKYDEGFQIHVTIKRKQK